MVFRNFFLISFFFFLNSIYGFSRDLESIHEHTPRAHLTSDLIEGAESYSRHLSPFIDYYNKCSKELDKLLNILAKATLQTDVGLARLEEMNPEELAKFVSHFSSLDSEQLEALNPYSSEAVLYRLEGVRTEFNHVAEKLRGVDMWNTLRSVKFDDVAPVSDDVLVSTITSGELAEFEIPLTQLTRLLADPEKCVALELTQEQINRYIHLQIQRSAQHELTAMPGLPEQEVKEDKEFEEHILGGVLYEAYDVSLSQLNELSDDEARLTSLGVTKRQIEAFKELQQHRIEGLVFTQLKQHMEGRELAPPPVIDSAALYVEVLRGENALPISLIDLPHLPSDFDHTLKPIENGRYANSFDKLAMEIIMAKQQADKARLILGVWSQFRDAVHNQYGSSVGGVNTNITFVTLADTRDRAGQLLAQQVLYDSEMRMRIAYGFDHIEAQHILIVEAAATSFRTQGIDEEVVLAAQEAFTRKRQELYREKRRLIWNILSSLPDAAAYDAIEDANTINHGDQARLAEVRAELERLPSNLNLVEAQHMLGIYISSLQLSSANAEYTREEALGAADMLVHQRSELHKRLTQLSRDFDQTQDDDQEERGRLVSQINDLKQQISALPTSLNAESISNFAMARSVLQDVVDAVIEETNLED